MSEEPSHRFGHFHRLQVFESITDPQEEVSSRVLAVVALPEDPNFADVYELFRTFGPLASLEENREVGEVVVYYFDLRHAKQAFTYLTPMSQVIPLPDYSSDCVAIFSKDYSCLSPSLESFGDIAAIKLLSDYSLIQYFDLRCAATGVAELTRCGVPSFLASAAIEPLSTSDYAESVSSEESIFSGQKLVRDVDVSIGSERTLPSPYVNQCSSSYSEEGSSPYLESPQDDLSAHRRKPRKKPMDDEDKSLFELKIEKILDGSDTRTTVMIKNIPNKYTQKMLLVSIDKHFVGTYDFFYLPIDFKNKCNVGYAFVNFLDCSTIPAFYKEKHGKKWERFKSEKICAITYARIQGRAALIQHFQSSSVMNQEDQKVKPLILYQNLSSQ